MTSEVNIIDKICSNGSYEHKSKFFVFFKPTQVRQTANKNDVSFSTHFVVSKLFDHRCHRRVTSACLLSVSLSSSSSSSMPPGQQPRDHENCQVVSTLLKSVVVKFFGRCEAMVVYWSGFHWQVQEFFFWRRGVLKGLEYCGVYHWLRGCLSSEDTEDSPFSTLIASAYRILILVTLSQSGN